MCLDLGSAVLAIDCFLRINGPARLAVARLRLRSRDGESLAWTRIEVELVTTLAPEPRNLVLLKSPLPFRRARYLCSAFRAVYAHRFPKVLGTPNSNI